VPEYRFPNESDEYRAQRNALLELEVALRSQVEAVAQKRRELPLGGRIKEDYRFEQVDAHGQLREVAFADLFGEHDTLLFYSMMFGPDWDAPCPACTSLVDGFNATHHSVVRSAAFAVVAAGGAEQLHRWAQRRGWNSIPLVSGARSSYMLDYAGDPDSTDAAMVSIMNVFRRTPDGIFHTWASELVNRPMDNGHPRHVDLLWPLWNLLDLTPEGRGDAPAPKQDYEHAYFDEHVMGGQG
jgi:predicted dithiol-disulfide oxidoreductase (DUF899 family)